MLRSEYEAEFNRFRPELESFLFRLLTNREDAEDLVHETWIKAFQALDGFEGRSSFKTWVFAIALNLARNLLARQKRWSAETQNIVAGMHAGSPELMADLRQVFADTPERRFEIKEHIDYCFTCTTKTLPLDQQLCLLLKEIYQFKMRDIMTITGLSEGRAKHALADARAAMTRIFAGKCAFVNKAGVCHQCTTLQGLLNPEQNEAARRNRIEASPARDAERLLELRLAIVRDVDPLNDSNSALHAYLLENNPGWVTAHLRKNSQTPSEKSAPSV